MLARETHAPWLCGACAALVSISVAVGSGQLRPEAVARLIITSEPQASVFLDGVMAGRVGPDGEVRLTVPTSATRSGALQVRLPGRVPFEQSIILSPGRDTAINAVLPLIGKPSPKPPVRRIGGTLEVLTTPGAQVAIDGKAVGTADAKGQLTITDVGAEQVPLQIRRPGYQPIERTITVHAGEITTVSESLKEVARPVFSDLGLPPAPDFSPYRSLVGHPVKVSAVAFSPDSRWLASGDAHGTLRLWDVATGRQVRMWDFGPAANRFQYTFNGVAFSPDGRLLAGGQEYVDAIHVVDVGTGEVAPALSSVDCSQYSLPCFSLSADSRQMASQSRGSVRIVDVTSGEHMLTLDACCAVMPMPDGGWIVLPDIATRGSIRVFDRAGKEVRTIADSASGNAAVTRDGRWLAAVGYGEKHIQIWDTQTAREGYTLRADNDEDFDGVAFSSDGRWLVSRGDGYISRNGGRPEIHSFLKVWDMTSGQVVRRYTQSGAGSREASRKEYDSLGYSPNGEWLALGANDGSIKLWRRKP